MNSTLSSKIYAKQAKIAVIGLGYVGLSIFDAFARAGFQVIGYDCNKHRIDSLLKGELDIVGLHLSSLFTVLQTGQGVVSCEEKIVDSAEIFIIAVPTPLDTHKVPTFCHLKQAAELIKNALKPGSLVILQSTSYPGTTEKEILPILCQSQGQVGKDFHLAFIPEISDFGNEQFDFAHMPKIIGGVTNTCAELAFMLYKEVTEDVTIVSSPKVAEAAKLLQNIYRLINLSWINEMKILFDKMELDIWEVIEAAAKKPFGFTPFYPGPGIGGDCIPVNGYYLIWEARKVQGPSSFMDLAEEMNTRITDFVVDKIIDALSLDGVALRNSQVLILGATFKKNVNDMREAPCLRLLSHLQQRGIHPVYHDPYIKEILPSQQFPTLHLTSLIWEEIDLSTFDCVVIITDHSFYSWEAIGKQAKRIVDTRNVMAPFVAYASKVIKG